MVHPETGTTYGNEVEGITDLLLQVTKAADTAELLSTSNNIAYSYITNY